MKSFGAVVLCLAAEVLACAQTPGRGVIAGIVIDASNNQPVRKAVVTVTLQATPRAWATGRTDGSGRFRFDGLPGGKYDLRATKAGVGSATYGATGTRELGEMITLESGESRMGLKLQLIRTATISGHVFEPDGDPAMGTLVALLTPTRAMGERVLQPVRETPADDRGAYRFDGVAPGQYYLRASPLARARAAFSASADLPAEVELPQFLGGAATSKDARTLNIHGDENFADNDFHLTTQIATSIRGRVLGVPDPVVLSTPAVSGRPLRQGGVSISLMQVGDDARPGGTSGMMAQPPEYVFNLGGIAPGSWRVEARAERDGKTWGASQVVDAGLGGSEVVLTLAPAVSLKGKLQIEGTDAPARNTFRVQLTQPERRGGAPPANVAADGSFTLPQVLPGEWEIDVPVQRGAFLKSLMLGNRDIRFTRVEIAPDSDETISIVVSTKTGQVHGVVEANEGDSKRAGILLAPVGPFHNLARFYYGSPADDDGKFEVKGIAPGKYKIFALEKLAAMNFATPEAGDRLDSLGQEIEIAEGAVVEVRPKLIPAERAREALP